MALKKTQTTVHGLEAADAYHRVESLVLNGKDKINFKLRSYADKDKPFYAEQDMTCSYDMNGSNPFQQAYVFVKTTGEFVDAQDC